MEPIRRHLCVVLTFAYVIGSGYDQCQASQSGKLAGMYPTGTFLPPPLDTECFLMSLNQR